MKLRQLLIAGFLLAVAQGAFAQQAIDVNGVLDLVKQAIAPAIGKLTTQAITWLGIFAVLQFFITNYNLLKGDGDIQSGLGKLGAALVWVGVCLYLIQNGPQFIQAVGDQMMSLLGMDLPSPASIVTKTVMVASVMGATAIGVSAIPLVGDTAGLLLVYVTLAVLAIGLLFAFKIFMLQLEIMLVALLAPLSFAFLGMNSLKDQGIAPFKALISFAYRVILLTVILSGFNQVSDIVSNVISNVGKAQFIEEGAQKVVGTVLSALGAYLLLAYLAFKSDSIAATLASGSTSMGTGDVAQAAATGAALGAAVAAGGVTAATTGGKVPQSMSDFMDKMMGGGSIANASPMGGGGDAPSFTPPPPSMSAGGQKPSSELRKPPPRSQAAAGGTHKSVASGRYGPPLPGDLGYEPETAAPAEIAANAPASQPGTDGAKASSNSAETQSALPPSTGGGLEKTTSAGTSAQQAASTSPAAAQSEPVTVAPARSKGAQSSPAKDTGARPADSAPGSGLSTAISGQTQNTQNQSGGAPQFDGPRKPTLGERIGEANRNMAQEQAATHISINTHTD